MIDNLIFKMKIINFVIIPIEKKNILKFTLQPEKLK